MAWWLTPLVLGALAVLAGVYEYPVGWLQWIGLGLVVIGLVVAVVHPGSTRRRPGRASDVRTPAQPYFS